MYVLYYKAISKARDSSLKSSKFSTYSTTYILSTNFLPHTSLKEGYTLNKESFAHMDLSLAQYVLLKGYGA